MTQKKISIAIAGSTQNTVKVAKCLIHDPNFSLNLVITPEPKKVGRKQIITSNPLDVFAKEKKINKILIEKRIDNSIKNQINEHKNIDILLVVDFGYYVPQWLLKWPKIAPLNIHPSALPQWRGSSPGQFSLLFGDEKSAVTLMIMNSVLDQGDIIHQEFFNVDGNWTQAEYYNHSFNLICKKLPSLILSFVQGKIKPRKQPELSTYPIARQLTKEDSFVEWTILKSAIEEKFTNHNMVQEQNNDDFFTKLIEKIPNNPILKSIFEITPNSKHPNYIYQAYRAFSPWPGLWTYTPTEKGLKRMKILECELLKNDQEEVLILKKVQIEGKTPASWKELKKTI